MCGALLRKAEVQVSFDGAAVLQMRVEVVKSGRGDGFVYGDTVTGVSRDCCDCVAALLSESRC